MTAPQHTDDTDPANPAPRPAAYSNPDPLLTLDEAGDYLRTGKRYIRRLIAEKRLACVRIAGRLHVRRSTLDAYLEAITEPAAADEPARKDPDYSDRVAAMAAGKAARAAATDPKRTGRTAATDTRGR